MKDDRGWETEQERLRQVNVGFIGTGAVGSTLARAFAVAGVPAVAVANRSVERATALAVEIPGCTACSDDQTVVDRSDVVFLTVPDGAIRHVCDQLEWTPGKSAVHCSGALSLDVLSTASNAGAQVGACHPFQTFVGIDREVESLTGCMFGVEASGPLRQVLDDVVQRLGGWTVTVQFGDRSSYHLAGVLASNYLVTLAAEAANLLEDVGLTRDDALRGLLPILQETVKNLDVAGLPSALTGPIARGDTATVRRHLMTLADRHPELVPLYVSVGARTLAIARELGSSSDEELTELEYLLAEYNPAEPGVNQYGSRAWLNE